MKSEMFGVGYKRPPTHTQFKKGQSGNPRGRPRGVAADLSLSDEPLLATVHEAASRTIPVREGDRISEVPIVNVLVQAAINAGLKGNARTLGLVFDLLRTERKAVAALALEFCILNASRSGEVLGARWQEIDRKARVWTIPAHRMKGGREHRVPLTARALEILDAVEKLRIGEFVFPGRKPDRPLSGMAMEMLLRRMKVDDATVHGFRSSFRDWAGEETHFAREVAEAALAHAVGDEVEQAYRRGDALAKRRRLMEAWAGYCAGETMGEVVQLAASA